MITQVLDMAVALEEHAPLGEIVDVMGHHYRLKREIPREEYERQLEANRKRDRERGLPNGKSGIYSTGSKQYEPTWKLPDSFQYCYEIEPVTAADRAGTPRA